MNTAELKLDLIKKITNITDELKLREIVQLLELQADEFTFETSKEDKKAILEARKQVEKGETMTNEEVQKAIKKCLYK